MTKLQLRAPGAIEPFESFIINWNYTHILIRRSDNFYAHITNHTHVAGCVDCMLVFIEHVYNIQCTRFDFTLVDYTEGTSTYEFVTNNDICFSFPGHWHETLDTLQNPDMYLEMVHTALTSRNTQRETTMPCISTNRRRRYHTLVPFSSFTMTAKILSDRDLKFMRVAALRVLRSFDQMPEGLTDGRKKAIGLWENKKQALVRYGMAIALELKSRGFENTSLAEFKSAWRDIPTDKPNWVYWPRLHQAARSYLKLRGLRDNLVKLIHKEIRETDCESSLRKYVQNNDCANVRNMTYEDIERINPDALYGGHYNDIFFGCTADETYIYPEPITS